MMKKLFTLLLTAACFTASAQIEVEYPYNPDADGNGFVSVSDILQSLSVYDDFYSPQELIVGDSLPLSAWIPHVNSALQEQQDVIDSLLNEYDNLTDLISMEQYLITSGVCSINYSDTPDEDFHYYVPSSCRFVNMVTYYYGGISTECALRLPLNGLFEGQIIEFALNARTPLSPATIRIEAFQNGEWVLVGSVNYTGCTQQSCQGQYTYLTSTNERVVWTGSEWVNTVYTPISIGLTQE